MGAIGQKQSLDVGAMRCSYGVVHRHSDEQGEWARERTFGIAAQSRAAVDRLLENWVAAGTTKQGVIAKFTKRAPSPRQVEAVEYRDYAIPESPDGVAWWAAPADE